MVVVLFRLGRAPFDSGDLDLRNSAMTHELDFLCTSIRRFCCSDRDSCKIGIKGVDSNLATAIRTVVILLFAWGIVFVQGTTKQLRSLSHISVLFLILSGIATGLSWLFYFRALQLGSASRRLIS